MSDLSPELSEQLEAIIKSRKPHFAKLEAEALRIGFGTIVVHIGVRDKIINKMEITSTTEQWVKPLDPKPTA